MKPVSHWVDRLLEEWPEFVPVWTGQQKEAVARVVREAQVDAALRMKELVDRVVTAKYHTACEDIWKLKLADKP